MTPAPAFYLCVYCGSSPGHEPGFMALATEVGHWIGRHGGQLVYGGGRSGLMGAVAQATLDAGGRVVGVIPQALIDRELAEHGCTELHVVQTMHERKRMMMERSDAFLALPGGIGTLEEFFEVWTWRQLGYHDKPVGLLDHEGFYRPMLDWLAQVTAHGFMREAQNVLITVGTEPSTLLPALVQAAGLAPAPHPERL